MLISLWKVNILGEILYLESHRTNQCDGHECAAAKLIFIGGWYEKIPPQDESYVAAHYGAV